jgi:hypothetical protein
MRPFIIPTIILILILVLIFLNFTKKKKTEKSKKPLEIEERPFTLEHFWTFIKTYNTEKKFTINKINDIKSFLNSFDKLINILNTKEIYNCFRDSASEKVDFIEYKIAIISTGETFFTDFQKDHKLRTKIKFENRDVYKSALKKHKDLFSESYVSNIQFPDW